MRLYVCKSKGTSEEKEKAKWVVMRQREREGEREGTLYQFVKAERLFCLLSIYLSFPFSSSFSLWLLV
jgi:hypothetical protein